FAVVTPHAVLREHRFHRIAETLGTVSLARLDGAQRKSGHKGGDHESPPYRKPLSSSSHHAGHSPGLPMLDYDAEQERLSTVTVVGVWTSGLKTSHLHPFGRR